MLETGRIYGHGIMDICKLSLLILPNFYFLPLQSEIIENVQSCTNWIFWRLLPSPISNSYIFIIVTALCLLLSPIADMISFRFSSWAISTWLLTFNMRVITSSVIYKLRHMYTLITLFTMLGLYLISSKNSKCCLTFFSTTISQLSPQSFILFI